MTNFAGRLIIYLTVNRNKGMEHHMTETMNDKSIINQQQVLKRSSIPLFLQVASAMRRRIEVGIWAPGNRIPSLEELASEFSVARTTARQAVSELENEGIIWRKQGKGTFVNEHLEDLHWLNLQTEWGDLIHFIKGTTTKLLTSSENVELPTLPVEEGEQVSSYHYMKRLHLNDGKPYCVIDIYLDSGIYDQKSDVFDKQTVLSVLDSIPDMTITRAHQILTIGTADMENANFLGISLDAPVANVRRIITKKKKKIIYLGDVVYRADFVKLDIDLI